MAHMHACMHHASVHQRTHLRMQAGCCMLPRLARAQACPDALAPGGPPARSRRACMAGLRAGTRRPQRGALGRRTPACTRSSQPRGQPEPGADEAQACGVAGLAEGKTGTVLPPGHMRFPRHAHWRHGPPHHQPSWLHGAACCCRPTAQCTTSVDARAQRDARGGKPGATPTPTLPPRRRSPQRRSHHGAPLLSTVHPSIHHQSITCRAAWGWSPRPRGTPCPHPRCAVC